MWEAFKYTPTDLSAEQVEDVFAIIYWAEEGSNRRRDEIRTQAFWRDYLLDGMSIIIVAVEWDDLRRFSSHLSNTIVIKVAVMKYSVLLHQEPKSGYLSSNYR